jgi:hypothetical protein
MPNIAGASCPGALPTTHTDFCNSFKTCATCYCSSRLPPVLCQDVSKIYERMISMFGSVQRACEYQKDTPTQVCVDDWNCYRSGGRDSQGGLCSSTGNACPK